MTEIKSISEFVSPPATPAGPYTKPPEPGEGNSTALREGDIRKLFAILFKGDDALARRKDLTELHKRIVTMFTTLNQGLVETQDAKSRADRTELVQRLDQVERAVNGMEGALRIELEPMMRNILKSEIDRIGQNHSRKPLRALWIGIGLCCAVAAGAYYSTSISALAKQILPTAVIGTLNVGAINNMSTLSPNGGIFVAKNQVM